MTDRHSPTLLRRRSSPRRRPYRTLPRPRFQALLSADRRRRRTVFTATERIARTSRIGLDDVTLIQPQSERLAGSEGVRHVRRGGPCTALPGTVDRLAVRTGELATATRPERDARDRVAHRRVHVVRVAGANRDRQRP